MSQYMVTLEGDACTIIHHCEISQLANMLARCLTLARRSPALAAGARALHVEATKPSVEAAIATAPVLVFSKTHCPYCRRVKELFSELDVAHEVVELDLRQDGPEIQALLQTLTGQRTVPNVFIKGQHIGGCDATLDLHASKKLLPLLQ